MAKLVEHRYLTPIFSLTLVCIASAILLVRTFEVAPGIAGVGFVIGVATLLVETRVRIENSVLRTLGTFLAIFSVSLTAYVLVAARVDYALSILGGFGVGILVAFLLL